MLRCAPVFQDRAGSQPNLVIIWSVDKHASVIWSAFIWSMRCCSTKPHPGITIYQSDAWIMQVIGTNSGRDGNRSRLSLRLFFAPFNTSVLKPVLKKIKRSRKLLKQVGDAWNRIPDQEVWAGALARGRGEGYCVLGKDAFVLQCRSLTGALDSPRYTISDRWHLHREHLVFYCTSF